jgi:ribonuclease D
MVTAERAAYLAPRAQRMGGAARVRANRKEQEDCAQTFPTASVRQAEYLHGITSGMQYVDTEAALAAAAAAIRGADLIAADTEAAGYHRYQDRVCLLQLSTRAETFVIDTLALPELDGIAEPFTSPQTEVVLHDADYDLRLLARDFDLSLHGLFDTKLAAQFLGEPSIGLGSLVEKHLGVRLAKKYQRADWAQRPLPRDMVEYAAEDTRWLPDLRDALRAGLLARERLAWAEEEFRHQEAVRWENGRDDGSAYLRLKNIRDLKPRQLAALRELHTWREGVAEARDTAPFRVVSNEVLVAVARGLPRNENELAGLDALPQAIGARHGRALLAAVARALALSDAELPRRGAAVPRPAYDPEFERKVERLKSVRDRAVDRLGIERGFLMPRYQLESVARARPADIDELLRLDDMRRWQAEALGDALLRAVTP